MTEVNLASGRLLMQSARAKVALSLIAVKAVTTLDVDLLLEVEIVLQSLILEVRVEILVEMLLASSIDIIQELLLKGTLVLD